MVTKEEFSKVWKDSTKEDILNQFYYEHNDLREMLKENGNKEEVINQLTNNWNELEEWLIDYRTNMDNPDIYEEGIIDCLDEVLGKMKEMGVKGESK